MNEHLRVNALLSILETRLGNSGTQTLEIIWMRVISEIFLGYAKIRWSHLACISQLQVLCLLEAIV